jgi:hypothetical protein
MICVIVVAGHGTILENEILVRVETTPLIENHQLVLVVVDSLCYRRIRVGGLLI